MTDPYKEIEKAEYEFIKGKISSLDYKNLSVEDIFEIIKPLRNGLHMVAIQTGSGLALFRGVRWNDKPKIINEISYPPKQFAKINRASQEGEQLFYSSTSKNITLYEMNAKKGDRIVLSEWRSTTDLVFPLIGFTNNNLASMGSDRVLDYGQFAFADEKFAKMSNQQIEIVEYLAKIFCCPINSADEEKYKLTIAIVRLLSEVEYRDAQKDDGKFSGLAYPSVKGRGGHDNYAVNIELIDNGSIEFYNAEFIEIVNYDKTLTKYNYRIVDYSDSIAENRIIWKGLKNTWTIWDDEEIFFDESDPIRAFTSDGNEYLHDKTQ